MTEGAGNTLQLDGRDTFAAVFAGAQPRQCRISARARFQRGRRKCGMLLRANRNFESSNYIRFQPQSHRLVFDRWPWVKKGAPVIELERPLIHLIQTWLL